MIGKRGAELEGFGVSGKKSGWWKRKQPLRKSQRFATI